MRRHTELHLLAVVAPLESTSPWCVCVRACMRDVKEVHAAVCRQLPSAFLCG